jgi:hypothetical protein
METDSFLWWFTLIAGLGAAGISVGTSVLNRSKMRPTSSQAFVLHIVSCILLSLSILGFIVRGLVLPT